jgi:hypothetical protein
MVYKYIDFITRQVNIPPEKKQNFIDSLDLINWTDQGTWNLQSNALAQDQSGNSKTVCQMYTLDMMTNKYSFFTADVQASYHVGEDMYVWRRQKSTFGGLF